MFEWNIPSTQIMLTTYLMMAFPVFCAFWRNAPRCIQRAKSLPSPAVSHSAEIRKINTAAQWLMEPRSTKMCQMPWKYGRLSWAKK